MYCVPVSLAPGTKAREKAAMGCSLAENPQSQVQPMPGTAKRTMHLCKVAGIVLPAADSIYPYGVDPDDNNIRIAPASPP